MHVLYAQELLIKIRPLSLFLGGPSPRTQQVRSWRKDALDILLPKNLDITVFVPEDRNGIWDESIKYKEQIAWERHALKTATVLMFWIPRDLKILPGFTTNIEFGEWMRSGKVVLGAPSGTPKMGYLYYCAEEFGIPTATTLEETIALALAKLGLE